MDTNKEARCFDNDRYAALFGHSDEWSKDDDLWRAVRTLAVLDVQELMHALPETEEKRQAVEWLKTFVLPHCGDEVDERCRVLDCDATWNAKDNEIVGNEYAVCIGIEDAKSPSGNYFMFWFDAYDRTTWVAEFETTTY